MLRDLVLLDYPGPSRDVRPDLISKLFGRIHDHLGPVDGELRFEILLRCALL
jgi:hypothetical protein